MKRMYNLTFNLAMVEPIEIFKGRLSGKPLQEFTKRCELIQTVVGHYQMNVTTVAFYKNPYLFELVNGETETNKVAVQTRGNKASVEIVNQVTGEKRVAVINFSTMRYLML